ncbi:hypothetical protein MHYP_G00133390 [Metynnis hypsauchen]
MSKDKLEGLVKRMEVTLSEMEQLKHHCGRQSEELSQLVVELRRENQELTEKYNQLALDMKEAKEIIEQLQDTNAPLTGCFLQQRVSERGALKHPHQLHSRAQQQQQPQPQPPLYSPAPLHSLNRAAAGSWSASLHSAAAGY